MRTIIIQMKHTLILLSLSILLLTAHSQYAPPAVMNLRLPQVNFNFPTHKFAMAGNAFHQVQASVTPETQTIANVTYDQTSTFAGFSNSFKSEMAYLIASIKDLNTVDGRMLTDKLTMSLIAIDNTLNIINMNKHREGELKPLLQFQVKQFMSDIDMIKNYVTSKSTPTVLGDNNALYGKTGTILGTGNTVVGNSNHVVGGGNTLVGNKAIVSGFNNGVAGNNGVTVGTNNHVEASNTYVFGSNGVVGRDNALIVGNKTIDLQRLGIYNR